MILHLIRHPKPLIAPGVCYGQLDIPAENPAGLVAGLRRQIPAEVPVWSSPLQRCRALAGALHPAPRFDERLMEMNFGLWEGRPWDAVPRSERDAWAADLMGFAPPGGESAEQVKERLSGCVAACAREEIALVTHAGIIRLLLSMHHQQPLRDFLDYPVPYGGLVTVMPFVIF